MKDEMMSRDSRWDELLKKKRTSHQLVELDIMKTIALQGIEDHLEVIAEILLEKLK